MIQFDENIYKKLLKKQLEGQSSKQNEIDAKKIAAWEIFKLYLDKIQMQTPDIFVMSLADRGLQNCGVIVIEPHNKLIEKDVPSVWVQDAVKIKKIAMRLSDDLTKYDKAFSHLAIHIPSIIFKLNKVNITLKHAFGLTLDTYPERVALKRASLETFIVFPKIFSSNKTGELIQKIIDQPSTTQKFEELLDAIANKIKSSKS